MITIRIVHSLDAELSERLDDLFLLLGDIRTSQERMMATLDQVLADVTQETTDLASISTLIEGLKQQLKDALANSGISVADQAKIDQIFATAESNRQKIAEALAANVSPAP